ncbi:hypothetical protein Trydic_g14253 [Trypoxylus dichotomus]
MVRASEIPSELWKAVKVPKRQRVPVPLIHGARGVALTTADKVEGFAEALERQCSTVYENADVDRIGRIHRQVRDLLTAEEVEEPIRLTSPEEMKAIVMSFRPNKVPGPRSQACPQEVRHATPAPLTVPMEASRRSPDSPTTGRKTTGPSVFFRSWARSPT